MPNRWLGLVRPHQRKTKSRASGRTRVIDQARSFWRRPTVIALRSLGWAGALACALAFNVIAVRALIAPDAYASMRFANIKTPPRLTTPDPADVRLLAATMWGEARSEGEDGMRAVAHVMVNRIGPRFGGDLRSVIMAPWQFSVWNADDPNRPLVRNPEHYAKGGENRDTWIAAQRIAYEVLSGASVDPTNGALFYHTTAIKPRWSHFGVGKEIIGAHVFYRDVPNQIAGVRQISSERARSAMNRAAAAAAAPPQRSSASAGPRAGRVNGVIQRAPAPSEPPAPAEIVVDVNTPLTPPELAAAISL
ncbi:MAG: cell wall hydrolase [Hyphomonadaceae bacterium]|nr:cell wall hydrolase [Hyphomonadaceae bacterium]